MRAPSVGELFAPQSQTSPLIGAAGTTGQGDPCDVNGAYRTGANASQVRGLCIAQGLPSTIVDRYTFDNTQIVDGGVTGGNPNLRPETADTYTAGVVVTPGFDAPILRRLNISVDYYNITISKVVGTIDGLTALQRCYNLDGSNPTYNPGNVYCSLFGRSTSTGQINSFSLTNQNLGRYKTSGLDIALDWNVPLSALGISDRAGSLHLTAAATRLLAFEIQTFPGDPNVNYRGYIGDIGYPKWRSVETLTYLNGGFSIGLQHRYIDGMVDVGLIGTDDRSTRVPAINYFDLNLAVAVSKAFSVRLGVNNLTDARPRCTTPFHNRTRIQVCMTCSAGHFTRRARHVLIAAVAAVADGGSMTVIRIVMIALLSVTVPLASAMAETAVPAPSASAGRGDAQGFKPSITKHKGRFGKAEIHYEAIAETIPIAGENGQPEAEIFSVGYTAITKAPATRPVTFLYNGGPGSASFWIQMGAFGPKIVALNGPAGGSDRSSPGSPLVDNPDALLDVTDLVFIDPVGTGFSHAVGSTKDEAFFRSRPMPRPSRSSFAPG